MTVNKIAIPEHHLHPIEGPSLFERPLSVVAGVPIPCWIRIGTLTLSIAELHQLKKGQVMTLDQKTEEPVEIMVNQHVIARGELMSCDDHFAIQITEIAS